MKLLTPESVGEQLAVSRSTVLRMISDGALPAVCLRRGKRKAVYRVREEVLQKWVLSRETKRPASTRVETAPTSVDLKAINGAALD